MSTKSELRLTDDNETFADPAFREQLRDLPPSAKLVAKVLEESSLSKDEIAEESLLPDRTVRYALDRLDDAGLVGSRPNFTDARKRVYHLDYSSH